MRYVRLLVSALVLLCAASAGASRYAVVIGANRGDPSDVVLRYAQTDAQRVGRVLRTLGGFEQQDIVQLEDPTADEVRRTLIALNARIRQAPEGALLFVFYSGHGDADALHLTATRLPIRELRELLSGSPAAARVLVIDACHSGGATRVKGGRAVPAFEIRSDSPVGAEGLAILTSSAASEDSQESDRLGSSFFTHYFVSALSGAGDEDDDGVVSIGEAFDYAATRTLAATASSAAGPQHPTYGLELRGREALGLTRPGLHERGAGVLRFDRPGAYFVQRGGREGPIVVELTHERGGRRIALEAGRYFVTRRERSYLLQTEVALAAGETVSLDERTFHRVAYAQVVRKGGTAKRAAFSAFALAGVRGELLGLGTAWRTDVGARVDLHAVSLELRIGVSGSDHGNARLTTHTHELDVALAALRMFDLGVVSLGIGLEAGGLWLPQRFDSSLTKPRDPGGGSLAAVGQLHVTLHPRVYLRVDGALLTYFLPERGTDGAAHLTTPVTYRFSGGLGVFF